MNIRLLLVAILAFLPAGLFAYGDTSLTATLKTLPEGDPLQRAASAIQSVLNSSPDHEAVRTSISDSFCEALRGLTCAELDKVEENSRPIQIYESKDSALLCVIGDAKSSEHVSTLVLCFEHLHGQYFSAAGDTVLRQVNAISRQLPTSQNQEVRALVYGTEINSNRSPLSLVVVQASGKKVDVLLEQQNLVEGQVSIVGNTLTLTSTGTDPTMTIQDPYATIERKYSLDTIEVIAQETKITRSEIVK